MKSLCNVLNVYKNPVTIYQVFCYKQGELTPAHCG